MTNGNPIDPTKAPPVKDLRELPCGHTAEVWAAPFPDLLGPGAGLLFQQCGTCGKIVGCHLIRPDKPQEPELWMPGNRQN